MFPEIIFGKIIGSFGMKREILLLLFFLLFGACSSMKLTDEERSKLDPPLLRLLEKQPINESDYDIHIRPDGTKVYGVIIRGTNPEHISQIGIQLNSVFGNVITARLTLVELRRVLALPSVRAVQNSSKDGLH